MKMKFKVGFICFEISYLNEIQIPDNFKKFQDEECEPEYFYEIQQVDQLPSPVGQLITERIDLAIYEKNGLEERYIGIKNLDCYYAYYKELNNTHIQIKVLKSFHDNFTIDSFFTSLFALERRALANEEIILHSAYIEYKGQAILFSAPSETGKTTQANLWEKYRGAKTVNGDRSLLSKINGIWNAGGWPVCGSSEICNNITMPIRAIVMLSQAPENHVELLHPMKAFSQIYSQVTINRWNNNDHNKAISTIDNLINEVPVYLLSCNISENAVNCLDDFLERNLTNENCKRINLKKNSR